MKRFFTFLLGALAMVVVALVSAFISMRLAIHGREAVVPALTGMSVYDASKTAGHVGLRLALENRFYSTDVPAGRVLAQDPAPGSKVRREWPIRITESLGSQRVNVPDLSGESERAATVSIRRSSLDLGVVAHLAVQGDPDVVLSQTPEPNSAGADGPRVSLLVSDPEDESDKTAYVMPSLLGLTYNAAVARASTVGLHVIADTPAPPPEAAVASPGAPSSGAAGGAAQGTATPAAQPTVPVAVPVAPPTSGTVLVQNPPPGRRVVQGDAVHVLMGHAASTVPAAALSPQPTP